MLQVFNHPSKEFKNAVAEQLELFNPDDLYWKVNDDIIAHLLIAELELPDLCILQL